MVPNIIEEIRKKKPLVHCITNYVTANDVANIILAAGGKAVMADGEKEAEDVTAVCQALVLNMGTLKEEAIPAMIKAGKKANALGLPVVFDPVGAGGARFRTESCRKVFESVKVSLVRGNASEIKALARAVHKAEKPCGKREILTEEDENKTRGVDVSARDKVTEDNLEENIRFAEDFAEKHGIIVLMTGNIDIVAGEGRIFLSRGGTERMAKVTGAGCMLDGLAALFLAASGGEGKALAAALAVAAEGFCAEAAEKQMDEMEKRFPFYSSGTGSFRVFLIDQISRLTDEKLKEGMKIEDWKRKTSVVCSD